ncbi:hypothetical protein PN498_05640 [Oscillatoria sp. CS-180]|uniref:hypothetical protein n=1 Tax=Oscillatoria sp. CS-180 TaxID=3021720 RepID=UPI00232E0ADC|nr:hypothetical protein [Oscillatoria sp. CS-180]MDB9525461.1 hypothetical protein [Oscillatoria sp. CS-180]
MQKKNSWQLIRIGALSLGVAGIYGCPQALDAGVSHSAKSEAITIVQSQSGGVADTGTDTGITNFSSQPVAYEICGESPGWQRTSFSEQTTALLNNPRYGAALEEEPLRGLSDKFWNGSVITFTTYGLSARTEPIFLSGVWTSIDAMDACYEGDRPEAINQGVLAEVWLIGNEIDEIAWTGSEYEVTVRSASEGLQFVQFERLETNETLPIRVVSEAGTELPVVSGDW